jgi:hypothetical protein
LWSIPVFLITSREEYNQENKEGGGTAGGSHDSNKLQKFAFAPKGLQILSSQQKQVYIRQHLQESK